MADSLRILSHLDWARSSVLKARLSEPCIVKHDTWLRPALTKCPYQDMAMDNPHDISDSDHLL